MQTQGYSILNNGAQIVKGSDGTIVAEWPLTTTTCVAVADYCREQQIDFWINDNGVDHFPLKGSVTDYQKQSDIWHTDSPRSTVAGYVPAKPFVFVAHAISEQTLAALKAFVGSLNDDSVTTLVAHEVGMHNGLPLFDVFVIHKQANKLSALQEVAHLTGSTVNQCMMVGDGLNDAVVIEAAGIGVAVANAAAKTLSVATYIAPDYTANGAAVALEFALQLADPATRTQ